MSKERAQSLVAQAVEIDQTATKAFEGATEEYQGALEKRQKADVAVAGKLLEARRTLALTHFGKEPGEANEKKRWLQPANRDHQYWKDWREIVAAEYDGAGDAVQWASYKLQAVLAPEKAEARADAERDAMRDLRALRQEVDSSRANRELSAPISPSRQEVAKERHIYSDDRRGVLTLYSDIGRVLKRVKPDTFKEVVRLGRRFISELEEIL